MNVAKRTMLISATFACIFVLLASAVHADGYYSRKDLRLETWVCTFNYGCVGGPINFDWIKILTRGYHYENSGWIEGPEPDNHWVEHDHQLIVLEEYGGCVGEILQCVYGEGGEARHTENLPTYWTKEPYSGCCAATCQYLSDSTQCPGGWNREVQCADVPACNDYGGGNYPGYGGYDGSYASWDGLYGGDYSGYGSSGSGGCGGFFGSGIQCLGSGSRYAFLGALTIGEIALKLPRTNAPKTATS